MTRFENVGVFIRENVWLENSLSQQGNPPSYWLRLFLSQTFSRINTPVFSNLVILHTYPPTKMEQTECSKTSAYKIQTLGNYQEESIQHSEHGESRKTHTNFDIKKMPQDNDSYCHNMLLV
jgi:hypothetical protein